MKENKYLCTYRFRMQRLFSWFLIVTVFVFIEQAQSDDSSDRDLVYYDSSIQRSNFLAIEPRYIDDLLKTIENRRAAFLWKLRFDAQSLQTSDNIQSQILGATVRTRFRYKILDSLDFRSKVNMSLESGRSQSIFGDLEPSSGIYPREIKLEWRAIKDRVTIDFGQIHQNWFNEPLFIGNLGFPGTAQKFKYNFGRISSGITTQQLIPTSSTLSTRVGEREPVPYLFTESIEIGYAISSVNWLQARYTHFRYNNLPSAVAFQSGITGNNITGGDVKSAEFLYDFNGYMTNLTFEQKITHSLAAQARWNVIHNNRAPSQNSDAQSASLWVNNDFGRWILGGRYTNYFIEADAVPGAYNTHLMGNTNRIGNAFELNYESKDWGVVFRGIYTKADLLDKNPRGAGGIQQDNQQTFYFAVETMYDFI